MSEILEASSALAAAPSARDIAGRWLADFETALEQRNTDMMAALFLPDGWWRDLLAFTWDLRTFHGTAAIVGALDATLEATLPTRFRLTEGKEPAMVEADANTAWVQAFFDFETAVALGSG